MKTIPYSINEANGKPVMSLAWNEDYCEECEPMVLFTDTGQIDIKIEEEYNE
ncbi:MAG: hypothetical protein ACXVAY_07090 [Mucilaginibacter sp.]